MENVDGEEFPLFEGAEYVEGVVGPGEALYVPVSSGWGMNADCRGGGGIL